MSKENEKGKNTIGLSLREILRGYKQDRYTEEIAVAFIGDLFREKYKKKTTRKKKTVPVKGVCQFSVKGLCCAMGCYSSEECGARDEHGNPKYADDDFIEKWQAEKNASDSR